MESPYPPQLSPTVGPSPSSNPSPDSAVQAAPLASTSSSSSEPRRQQQRKRALPTESEVDERGFECGPGVDALGADDGGCEVDAGRLCAQSVRAGARGEVARRLASRAKGARRTWMAREVGDGSDAATSGGPSTDFCHQEKRRRVDEDESDAAYQTASGARERVRSPRPAPLFVPPAYGDSLDVNPASPASYLGVFPTSFAAEVVPEPSSTQPPPASPAFPPPSTLPAQRPFPTPPLGDLSAVDVRPRLRRRANSVPLASPRRSRALPATIRSSPEQDDPRPTGAPAVLSLDREASLSSSDGGQKRPPSPDRSDAIPHVKSISHDVLRQFFTSCIPALEGTDAASAFVTPGLIPPVSTATLGELDFHNIMRNPQLRHDVVFDPNLMFRPNYDGEKGERKRFLAAQYWTAVAREIDDCCRCTTFYKNTILPCVCQPRGQAPSRSAPVARRLPSRLAPLLTELRNIFASILPAPSAPSSPELASSPTFANCFGLPSPRLDMPAGLPPSSTPAAARELLMKLLLPQYLLREIELGAIDVPVVARFLATVIKQHCAPMRDAAADAMVYACEAEGLARGLQLTFELLELMKLDIANHQLRSFRQFLVRGAREFEWEHYTEYSVRRPDSVNHVLSWLRSAAAAVDAKDQPRVLGRVERIDQAVTHGLLDIVFPADEAAQAAAIPETLQFDSYRIQAFHADATDLTVIYLLTMLFGQLAYPARPSPADVDALRQELWCIMSSSTRTPTSIVGPAAAVSGIPQGPPGLGLAKLENAAWRAGMQDVLLQVARRATELRQCAKGDASAAAVVPDAETVALVSSYFDTNVRASSKLFQLLQRRLRETLHAVVDEELAKEKAQGPLSFMGWWAPQGPAMSMRTGGARRAVPPEFFTGSRGSSKVVRPDASMMASPTPLRGVKRSHLADLDADNSSSSSEDECSDKRQRTGRSSSISSRSGAPHAETLSRVDAALQRNGLSALSGEVRLLGMRIARVAVYNLEVYRTLYNAWLCLPRPTSA